VFQKVHYHTDTVQENTSTISINKAVVRIMILIIKDYFHAIAPPWEERSDFALLVRLE